jgi:Rod binding domain-containing protein
VAMSRRGGLGLAQMLEKHLTKINSSSKQILENRFQINKPFELEKTKKSINLKDDKNLNAYPLKNTTAREVEFRDIDKKYRLDR